MVDTHSHCLPGVDDGPDSQARALEMLRLASSAGVTTLLATPHFYPGLHEPAPELVQRAFDDLVAAAADATPELQLSLAREVMVTELPFDQLQPHLLCSLPSPLVLIELPLSVPKALRQLVFELRTRGYTLVLAHPERCPELVESETELEWLLRQGVVFQLTAPSLLGAYGKQVQAAALQLLNSGYAHCLASDAHSPQAAWPLVAARRFLEARFGPALADCLVRTWPARLLAGESLAVWDLSDEVRRLAAEARPAPWWRKFLFRSK